MKKGLPVAAPFVSIDFDQFVCSLTAPRCGSRFDGVDTIPGLDPGHATRSTKHGERDQ